MENNNLLTLLVIVIFIVSIVNISIALIKYNELNHGITGYASAVTGYVNVTITSALLINISRSHVDWGIGIVNTTNTSCTNVSLITFGDNTGVVTPSGCGNWSGANAKSIIVSNIGNINCSISIASDKNASDLFAAAGGNDQAFAVNVTNRQANSCGVVATNITLGLLYDVNKTGTGTIFCNKANFQNGANTLNIDFLLTLPTDPAPTKYGVAQTAIITITGDT
ncbi:MAG: hypothetical protein V1824_01715, partial [archaeon]